MHLFQPDNFTVSPVQQKSRENGQAQYLWKLRLAHIGFLNMKICHESQGQMANP